MKNSVFVIGVCGLALMVGGCVTQPLPSFCLTVVDGEYPGNGKPGWSAWGDVDSDGDVDVLAGGGRAVVWYESPSWERHEIEEGTEVGGNGAIVTDVDGDGDLDLITALFLKEVVWFENPGPGKAAEPWRRHTINGDVKKYSHDMVWGDIDGDGSGELVSLFTGGGVYWYDPGVDVKELWKRYVIVEPLVFPHAGLAIGDVDGDGDIDVVASNSWYENAGDWEGDGWQARQVYSQDVSNVACYDVNGDGKLDVIGSQGFNHPDGKIFWVAGPGAEKDRQWREFVVGEDLDGPESIWAGDLNGDGRVEIMTAEMGTSAGAYSNVGTLLVFEAVDGEGSGFVKHVVASGTGMTTRLNAVDIDGDGDLDFTADGNAENHIYLWENLSEVRVVVRKKGNGGEFCGEGKEYVECECVDFNASVAGGSGSEYQPWMPVNQTPSRTHRVMSGMR